MSVCGCVHIRVCVIVMRVSVCGCVHIRVCVIDACFYEVKPVYERSALVKRNEFISA